MRFRPLTRRLTATTEKATSSIFIAWADLRPLSRINCGQILQEVPGGQHYDISSIRAVVGMTQLAYRYP